MLTMSSAFLPVDEKWEEYLERADAVYNSMEVKVQDKLKQLAEAARRLAETSDESWKSDPWLNQLDWTPQSRWENLEEYIHPKRVCVLSLSRKGTPDLFVLGRGSFAASAEETLASEINENARPSWYLNVLADPRAKQVMHRILPLLLKTSYSGYPLHFSPKVSWHYILDNEPRHLSLRANGQKSAIIFAKYVKKPVFGWNFEV